MRTPLAVISTAIILAASTAEAQQERAQNVILFIGDGMGLPAIAAGSFAAQGMAISREGLSFESFPVLGYATTFSSDSFVPDSAATATAMASGIKTYNGAIGVDDSRAPVQTILEWAVAEGRTGGLVSSVPINHATPAAFGAHETSRGNTVAILSDLLTDQSAQVMLSGGIVTLSDSQALAQASAEGYVALGMAEVNLIATIQPGDRVFGVFDEDGDDHLAYRTKRDSQGSGEPLLADLAVAAVRALSADPDGFVLMVEGGAIDWAGHANDAANVIGETLEFSDAIQAVLGELDALGTLAETLIIVTADHETGGVALTGPSGETLPPDTSPDLGFVSTGHTALPAMIYATGPGSGALHGRQDNTHIYQAMRDALEASLASGILGL